VVAWIALAATAWLAASCSGARTAGAGATSSPHRLQELRLPLPRDKVLQLDQEPHLRDLRRNLRLEAASFAANAAKNPRQGGC